MKPITRKELYLNKIVGNNNYETPEKPITTEEFFFAEILGEAVQAPEPLTRYQMYLAKIAGKDVEIPYPETRLEYFLAKAAGMEIEAPTPITREEIFWSNYHAIVDFEIDGVPPLTYKAIEGTLENYRIYGNTVGGESVGDLVESGEHAGEYEVLVKVSGTDILTTSIYLPEPLRMVGEETEYVDYEEQKQHRVRKNLLNEEYIQGNPISNSIIRVKCKTPIPLVKGELYTISFDSGPLFDVSLGSSPTPEYPFVADTTILSSCGNSLNWLTSPYTFECVNDGYISVTIRKKDNTSITPDEVNFAIQFEKNSTATSYEPYIEDTEIDVTLPALPTLSGTNTLSVGTRVQPSKVYVKGEKEREYT